LGERSDKGARMINLLVKFVIAALFIMVARPIAGETFNGGWVSAFILVLIFNIYDLVGASAEKEK
jgi:hypothetical protein